MLAEADRLLNDAIPSNLKLQERAGLDYVSDGEWRRESYMKVFSESVLRLRNRYSPRRELPIFPSSDTRPWSRR